LLTKPARSLTQTEPLAACYKQLNASVGRIGTATLQAETAALASGSAADDTPYQRTQAALVQIANARDLLAQQIKVTLAHAATGSVIPGLVVIEHLACTIELALADHLAAAATA